MEGTGEVHPGAVSPVTPELVTYGSLVTEVFGDPFSDRKETVAPVGTLDRGKDEDQKEEEAEVPTLLEPSAHARNPPHHCEMRSLATWIVRKP